MATKKNNNPRWPGDPKTNWPKPPLQVRIPADLVDRIDDERGAVPRETFVRALLDEAINHPRLVARALKG